MLASFSGLSPTTDLDLLKEVFGRFGKIVDGSVIILQLYHSFPLVCFPRCRLIYTLFIAAVMISDRETGISRGFGFVTYDSIDAANNAIQYMHEQVNTNFSASFGY